MEIKELAAGFVLENRVYDSHCASGEYCCGANATCASKCAPVIIIVERVNSAVVMLLVIYANVRNHALIYRAHITVSVHPAKIVLGTKNAP